MSTGSNIQDSILKAIDTMAQRRIDQLQLDKTITAIINAPIGVKNGRKIYKVEYEGGYFNATAQNKDDAYLPRMAVYVQVPQGDFSKEKFILGQASKLATDEQVSVVSATNNSFSIVGKNVIDNKTEKMGVYSYHSPTEEENSDILNHRFNFLYKSDQKENQIDIFNDSLNLYKKDATAIMVRAEFMTKLTSEQKKKATGEYGLVFDLVFNNLAAGLGETQGIVFNYFRKTVKVNRIIDGETKELSLNTIDIKLVEALKEKTYIELTETDGYLDEILNDIQELDRVYKNNNQTEYTFAVQDLISKYTTLVQDIKRIENDDEDEEKFRRNMQKLYQDWMDETIGQPAEKHVSYYLSSNDMIGNPFSFSSWISQYNIFEIDLENFKRIDSILLYKQGFIENTVKEVTWLNHEPDILVRDIQVYAMRPLSDNNSGYQLKVEGKDTGFVFEGKESDVNIIANATLSREYFEDLTRNSDTTFYWFKQSENVVSPMQSEYSIYGGIGWSEIDNQNSIKLEITKEDAPAYENHFRCAVVYMGEEVPIVLRYDFIVYNRAGERFILQSDLGTDFTFDAGVPAITVYKVVTEDIDDKKVERLEELHNSNQYNFKWAIVDGNNQKVFLDTKPELDLTDVTISNFNNYSNTSKLLKDIKWYRGDVEVTTETEKAYATKIKYPMSNIASSANITFECYISYKKENEEVFYPLGKTELTLNNFKILNANSYRIWIENGDQVFQYDEYGNAPNVDKYKDPIEVLPLKIHLFAPNNIEVQSSSFRTKWYFPTEESLIIYNSNEAEIDPETNNKNMFRGSEVSFNIKELYSNNAFDNQIECQIEFNDQILYAETALTFTKVGSNGTNGTDMVAKIVPSLNNNVLYEQPLIIYVDRSNENKVFLNTQRKNEAEDVIRITEGVEGILKPLLYQKSTQVDFNNVRWNIAGNTSTGTNKTGKYFSLDDEDIFYNKGFVDNKYRQQIIKSEIKYNSDQTYYAFYSLPIIEYEKAQDNNRIGIRNDTYIKEVLYNSDGRNPLYNHNQGLEILNLPDNCIISWTACGGESDNEDTPCFKLIPRPGVDKKYARKSFPLKKENGETDSDLLKVAKNFKQIYEELNDVDDENILQELNKILTKLDKVYILPNDTYNGDITNNYIQAIIKNNNNHVATIYAPIHMSLNTFGLASINAWDGNKVDINEAEDGTGYVMAPQIGAGEKDNNNRFTGILMGKARTNINTTQEENQIGLFGYAHGYQSIFLDAETGNSYFGLPDGKSLVKQGDDWIVGNDDYNEGRIELIPGDVSKIGGWRLGRRSLYYIQGEDGSIDIGKRYNEDYIPTKSGAVRKGDAYNKHHEKDIQEEYPGILLYSGQNPYISIKGRKLYPEIKYDEEGQPFPEQHPDTELLSQDSESYLLDGDSLELQLDPLTPTLFTIFRHNGQPRYKDSEQTNILYPIGSRTFLAGINGKGQLVANGLQNVTKPTDSASGDQVTTMGINTIPAFGENGDNASYIGLKTNVGDNVISKIFVKNNDDADSTLYLSGSGQRNNEYLRPISLHGKSVSLYTSNSSKDDITDSYIKVDQNNISAQLGTENNNLISFNRSSGNNISLLNSLTITLNNNGTKKDFNLTTGAQTINSTSIGIINTGKYTLTNTGVIDINTNGNADIKLTRNSGSNINIGAQNINIKINDDNDIKLDSSSNGGSYFKTKSPLLEIINNNGRLYNLGKSGVTGRTDLGDSASQIVIKAQDSSSNNYSVIRLGANVNNYVGITQNGNYVAGYPFTMLFGADSNGNPHCGSIYVRTSNTGRNSSNLNSNRVELNALGLQVAQGIEINGNLLNDTHESRGQYLIVNGNAQIHNSNSSAVLTADKFSGNGANITNTASGSNSGSANITISGVGGSGTAYVPKITLTNGRPSFSQEPLIINLPTATQIWNAISGNVSSAISSALSSYAKTSDLNNYAKTSDLNGFIYGLDLSGSDRTVVLSWNKYNEGSTTDSYMIPSG